MKVATDILEPSPEMKRLAYGQQRVHALEVKKAVREMAWRVETAGDMEGLARIDLIHARNKLNELLGQQ